MTKRPKRRDLQKYPLNPQELVEFAKLLKSQMNRASRAKKIVAFMEKARKHNTERGINPRARKDQT